MAEPDGQAPEQSTTPDDIADEIIRFCAGQQSEVTAKQVVDHLKSRGVEDGEIKALMWEMMEAKSLTITDGGIVSVTRH